MKILTLALIITAALPAVVLAASDVEAKVDAYLGSLDAAVTESQWKALGPDAIPVLEKRALTPGALPTVRARAAEALGLVGAASHAEPLLALARETRSSVVVRLSALRSAGKLLPEDRLLASLGPVLDEDAHPRLRGTAADVIAERLGDAGCERVKARAAREPKGSQKVYAPALKRCEKPKP